MTEPEFITSIHEMAHTAHINDPGADIADWLDAYQQCAQILGFSPDAEHLPEREADHVHHLVLTWGEDDDYDAGMRFFRECGCSLCDTALASWGYTADPAAPDGPRPSPDAADDHDSDGM